MDDNAVTPPGQQGTNPVGPTPPMAGNPLEPNVLGGMPSGQPVAPQPVQQVPVSQPVPPVQQSSMPQVPIQPEGSKITLEDLYGPSKPHELNQGIAEPLVPVQQNYIPEN